MSRRLTLLELLAEFSGHRVTAPGGLGGECVDWSLLYMSTCLGTTGPQSNAVDWATADVSGFLWMGNTPTNSPPKGAIVVWGRAPDVGIGPNGHIAVCLVAEVMRLLTADQNWPKGAPVGLILHTYEGVLGWWVPNVHI